MNLPNKLTFLRILLIPVFLLLILPVGNNITLISVSPKTDRFVAAFVFLVAALTDMLDGAIARKKGCVTVLGKFLDPIADKLLVISALIALVQLGEISSWAVIIIITREFIVQGIRILAARDAVVIPAGFLGKVKTFTQMVAIILILIKNHPFSLITSFPVGQCLLWVSVILTVISGYEYVSKNISRIKG
ncbi:MAG: CDP-diacylglycerol--glycerol-3-phosphate 3-phosphatidyltransferase [Bacillota bacterium]|jgi:CDP-diacylglycerol--glycerol-3-phosphate 3-phosphatidyltransferase|nr:CDP-diacylglycerol--glycerol-3-phosphate 3-phosphatidyltransferase [Bacillota bacterium]